MTRNVLRALKVFLAHDLVISFPGIHLTDTVSDSDLCIKMFTAMVFTIQKKENSQNIPQIRECIDEVRGDIRDFLRTLKFHEWTSLQGNAVRP